MTTQTAELLAGIDLVDLIGRDTRLVKVASTRGGEWAGPCPLCSGGVDRLRVQPRENLFWCRQCSPSEHWEDAIAYLRRRDGLSFPEALARLGGDTAATRPLLPPAPAAAAPDAAWQATVRGVVATAFHTLWNTDAGKPGRLFLARRGITAHTARAAHLGFVVASHRISDGSAGGLWVEAGVTIPWEADGQLWQVKIRRPAAAGGERYVAVRGGHPWLYGADDLAGRDPIVLCEGEFDALLLRQAAGDLAGVATLGSASAVIPGTAAATLSGASRILVAYDADDAGEAGARALLARSDRFRRIVAPRGKDLTAFAQDGGNLRDWLALELARHLPQPATNPASERCAVTDCAGEVWVFATEDALPLCGAHAVASTPGVAVRTCDTCGAYDWVRAAGPVRGVCAACQTQAVAS